MTDRCPWPREDPLMIAYHDEEWGVPVHEDRKLHEFLILDAFQAGLSWAIIMKKRDGFRRAFDDFQPEKVARFTERRVQRLLADPGIVRNQLKIRAAVSNARAFLDLQDEFGSFDTFIWQFTGGETKHNRWKTLKQIPSRSRESDAMSKALIARGFKFVGSTICYAFMQAAGMVNDHLVTCPRYEALARGAGARRR
jgi:DNA-3-methyladenine glycosylase I